jgi:hypothetical protein
MTYTEQVAAVLESFGAIEGHALELTVRSINGFGQEPYRVRLPARELPRPVLQALADGWHVRLAPVPRPVRQASAGDFLPVVFVTWRLERRFNPREREYQPSERAISLVKVAMELVPPATFLIESGAELWAGWRLGQPLRLARAARVLGQFAERLGADVAPLRDLAGLSLPLAGPALNSGQRPPWTAVHVIEPQRVYTLAEVLQDGDPPSVTPAAAAATTGGTDREPGSVRRARRPRAGAASAE